MKRTKEKTEIEIENEERQSMFASSISDAMKHQGSRFVVEPSYVNIENLSFGRLAFGGMNPEIEKMAEDERIKKEEAEEARKEKDVQDEEMVEFYGSISNTIGKKFSTKRNFKGDKMQQNSSSSGEPSTSANSAEFLSKGRNFVNNMRHQNNQYKKDKRPRMMKPSMD